MAKVLIRGFVKVNCEPSVANNPAQPVCEPVLRSLKSVRGVKDAYKTKNPDADFVAFLEAESSDSLNKTIEAIRAIPGIMRVDPEIEIPA